MYSKMGLFTTTGFHTKTDEQIALYEIDHFEFDRTIIVFVALHSLIYCACISWEYVDVFAMQFSSSTFQLYSHFFWCSIFRCKIPHFQMLIPSKYKPNLFWRAKFPPITSLSVPPLKNKPTKKPLNKYKARASYWNFAMATCICQVFAGDPPSSLSLYGKGLF